MKRIFWFLQQLEYLGGTETATISIANLLCNEYEITLVVTAKEPSNIPYNINKKIKILYLNNEDNSKIDEKILRFCSEKKYFKAFLLILKNIHFSLIGKYKYRNIIKKMTNDNDILIGSSLDNYLIIPKKRKYIYHYHYNFKFFKTFNERFMSLFYRKADKYVFLNEVIKNDISKKYKFYKNKSLFIQNPIKTKQFKNINYYNNSLVFLGRFAEQKNPLMLIEVAKILKENDFKFNLNLYGDGKLLKDIQKAIKKYKLENNVFINEPTTDIEEVLKKTDLLLLTSLYEGTPLVINEAFSQSVPCITTNFGDSIKTCVPSNCGLIIDNFDPNNYANNIMQLLNNKELYFKYRENAYNHSRSFSDEKIKENWINLIESL